MRLSSWLLAVFLILCTALPAAAGPAHLVADLSPGTVPWNPDSTSVFQSFTRLGDRVLFLSFLTNDVQCGLWVTDGTAVGTERLADLCAESLDPADTSFQITIVGVAGPLAFLLDPAARLWRTDGTAAGTYPLGVTVSESAQPVVGPNGLLYFVACDSTGDCQPWRSDGTVPGTRRLREFARQPDAFVFFQFVVQGDHMVFSRSAGQTATIWITDGTENGTLRLARLPSRVGYLLAVGGDLYVSTNGGSPSDVWLVPAGRSPAVGLGRFPMDFRSPGAFLFQAGGRILFEVYEGDGFVSLWQIPPVRHRPRLLARFGNGMGPLVEAGGGLVFTAAADENATNFSLWVLSPTMSHPREVRDCPEGCPGVDRYASELGVVGGRVVFGGLDQRGTGLWVTDGTGPGTRRLRDLCPEGCQGSPSGFTPLLGRLLFTSKDRELWVTDGSTAGTAQLGRSLVPGDAAEVGGRAVFDGVDAAGGSQPWVSDLTPAGTAPLALLAPPLAAGSFVQSLTPAGTGAFFGACGPGAEGVWQSDGTAAGTIRLVTADPGCASFFLSPVTRASGLTFFGLSGAHLWRTDGTPGGTLALRSWDTAFIRDAAVLDGRLLLLFDPEQGANQGIWTFWQSDGTPQGTVQTGAVELAGTPNLKGAAGNQAFFAAQRNEPPYPEALLRTDGTSAGTRALLDLAEEPAAGDVVPLGDGKALLVLAGAERGVRELWVTDGTAAGTLPVIADPGAARPQNPRSLAVFQGAAYLYAETGDPARPQGLWRSDGTAAGTFLVAAFPPPSDPSFDFAPELVAAGDFLFFSLDDGVHGQELWRTDGTEAGTVLVRDAAPGAAHSRPQSLTAAGGRLYFTATDGEHGLELWTSDGTAEGTAMVQDILPGPASSWPRDLVAADGNLFFTADDGEHGRELWVLPLAP
ncbi:MAG TPA: ELWxxDGT repeat protein [Thermoanaerobaculia bacterium]|nr:ELWxxDGT repeat protein [Thermoanaerobaculia bacterium]